jgi:hypothetical protein
MAEKEYCLRCGIDIVPCPFCKAELAGKHIHMPVDPYAQIGQIRAVKFHGTRLNHDYSTLDLGIRAGQRRSDKFRGRLSFVGTGKIAIGEGA